MRKSSSICSICPFRIRPAVWGEGDPSSSIAFVGQSPGAQEIKQHRPFVGPAGQRLDRFFAESEIARSSIWLTNVVKCYVPARASVPESVIHCCLPYLTNELAEARLIVSVGRVAESAVHQLRLRSAIRPDAVLRSIVHPAATLYRARLDMTLTGQAAQLKKELQQWRADGMLSPKS